VFGWIFLSRITGYNIILCIIFSRIIEKVDNRLMGLQKEVIPGGFPGL